jgi:hypothetical protein
LKPAQAGLVVFHHQHLKMLEQELYFSVNFTTKMYFTVNMFKGATVFLYFMIEKFEEMVKLIGFIM